MATRSILAVVEGDDFLGVKHTYDSYPSEFGNRLLLDLLRRKGNLDAAATAWIRDRPGGWSSFPNEPGDDEQPFYRRRDLDRLAWVDWFYLLDTQARRLSVYEGNPEFLGENRWGAPKIVVTIDGDGQLDPPVFSAPPPPWHSIPIDAGWGSDTQDARQVRSEFRSALEQTGDADAFSRTVASALATAIDGLRWKPAPPVVTGAEAELRAQLGVPREPEPHDDDGTLRIPFFWSDEDHYWEVALGPHRVCFPSGKTFRQEFEPLRLQRADGRTAVLELEEALTPAQLGRLPACPLQRWVTLEWLRLSQVPMKGTTLRAAPRPSVPAGRRFEYSDGRSDKFWEVAQEGTQVTTRWGRIGTRGQQKTKHHESEGEATAQLASAVRSKLAKGYLEVGPVPTPGTAPSATADGGVDPFRGRSAPAAPTWDIQDGVSRVTVTETGGGVWRCTCEAWEAQTQRTPSARTCRHIKRLRRDLERGD